MTDDVRQRLRDRIRAKRDARTGTAPDAPSTDVRADASAIDDLRPLVNTPDMSRLLRAELERTFGDNPEAMRFAETLIRDPMSALARPDDDDEAPPPQV